MKIKFPVSNNGFSPCESKEERTLYIRMTDLIKAIDGTEKAIKTANCWMEHEEELTYKNALKSYISELKEVAYRLHIMRPESYEIQ